MPNEKYFSKPYKKSAAAESFLIHRKKRRQ